MEHKPADMNLKWQYLLDDPGTVPVALLFYHIEAQLHS